MPLVLIEVRKKYPEDKEIALVKTVQTALKEAFQILKDNAVHVRLWVHEPHRSLIPLPKAYPELFTHISIDCFEGRSLETKRKLYRLILNNLETLGIPRDHVKILLRETPRENWGIEGGQAGCDVEDLGYTVEI